MDSQLIALIGDDNRIATMFNYIFYKGITASNYSDFIIYGNLLPNFINRRIFNVNDFKDDIFSKLFCIDKKLFDKNDWYDFYYHRCLKHKEINVNNSRIYNAELFTLNDISCRLGFAINNPIVKISELRKIFDRVINEIFGNLYLFDSIKIANDIALGSEVCIITGFNSNEEFNTFKQTFPFTGNVIDITGNSNFNFDYQIPIELLEKDSLNKFKQELKLFHHVKNIVKFIIL